MRVLRLSVVTRIIGRNTCWNRERFVTREQAISTLTTIPNFRLRGRENSGFGIRARGTPLTLR